MIRVATFGQAHIDPATDMALADCYMRVEAGTETEIRRILNDRFDRRWAFLYPDEDAAGVDEYGLVEIHLHGEGRPSLPQRQPGAAYPGGAR